MAKSHASVSHACRRRRPPPHLSGHPTASARSVAARSCTSDGAARGRAAWAAAGASSRPPITPTHATGDVGPLHHGAALSTHTGAVQQRRGGGGQQRRRGGGGGSSGGTGSSSAARSRGGSPVSYTRPRPNPRPDPRPSPPPHPHPSPPGFVNKKAGCRRKALASGALATAGAAAAALVHMRTGGCCGRLRLAAERVWLWALCGWLWLWACSRRLGAGGRRGACPWLPLSPLGPPPSLCWPPASILPLRAPLRAPRMRRVELSVWRGRSRAWGHSVRLGPSPMQLSQLVGVHCCRYAARAPQKNLGILDPSLALTVTSNPSPKAAAAKRDQASFRTHVHGM